MHLIKFFSIAPALFALTALASNSPSCQCGIAAIFEVGKRHGCDTPACACPHFDEWWPQVNELVQARCPEDSECKFTCPMSTANVYQTERGGNTLRLLHIGDWTSSTTT